MIHKALKLTREFHRIKQVELAKKLEISTSYLSEIEAGKKTISVDLLKQYAKVFDLPVETFLRFDETSPPTDSARMERANRLLSFFQWVAQENADEGTAETKGSAPPVRNPHQTVRSA